MIKEITVAGIKLNSYTALENLTRIGKRLDNNVFTTVQEIDMRTLLLAKEDAVVNEVVETLDVTVIAENGVWDASKSYLGKAKVFYSAVSVRSVDITTWVQT